MSRSRLVLALFLAASLVPLAVSAQSAQVRAVLFYSPTCPHCQKVIKDDLPPLFDRYGDQLQILGIDVTTADGQPIYQSAIEALAIPEDRQGLPTLVIGTRVLVGSVEIPEILPGVIEEGLAQGGIDWPAIPALQPALETLGVQPPAEPAAPKSMTARVLQDPVGNSLAISVLILCVIILIAVGGRWIVRPPLAEPRVPSWWAPLLAVVGMLVAFYLTFVEVTGNPAVCGPVGDCNAVQQSRYAFVFGLVPIGSLGVVAYATFVLLWATARLASPRLRSVALIGLFGVALAGTLFSIYLTFLEPFVIGATCIWCLTSAVIMAVLLWLSSEPARSAASLQRKPLGA